MTKSQRFANAPESVTHARHFAVGVLGHAPAEVLEVVALMVSELATNCVRHTHGAFDITVSMGAREVRVAATDHGIGEPVLRSPRPTDPNGRGLHIIDMLSAAWGVDQQTGTGKTVWFSLPLVSPEQ